jgi:hypothetical protein
MNRLIILLRIFANELQTCYRLLRGNVCYHCGVRLTTSRGFDGIGSVCEQHFWPGHKIEIENLLRHCLVHAGYVKCGYHEMSERQQRLFDEIIAATPPNADEFHQRLKAKLNQA